jgi:hypothetical protein
MLQEIYQPVRTPSLHRFTCLASGARVEVAFGVMEPTCTLLNRSRKLVRVTHRGQVYFLEPQKSVTFGWDWNEPYPEIDSLNNGVPA